MNELVPRTGLEPAHLAKLPPQSSVSTNFTTWALHFITNHLSEQLHHLGNHCSHKSTYFFHPSFTGIIAI
jgi:hypothetical protein